MPACSCVNARPKQSCGVQRYGNGRPHLRRCSLSVFTSYGNAKPAVRVRFGFAGTLLRTLLSLKNEKSPTAGSGCVILEWWKRIIPQIEACLCPAQTGLNLSNAQAVWKGGLYIDRFPRLPADAELKSDCRLGLVRRLSPRHRRYAPINKDTSGCRLLPDALAPPGCTAFAVFGLSDKAGNHLFDLPKGSITFSWPLSAEGRIGKAGCDVGGLLRNGCCFDSLKYIQNISISLLKISLFDEICLMYMIYNNIIFLRLLL